MKKSRISGELPKSIEEEHEEVKFVLPGSPLRSDESLENELFPPPPTPSVGMRKMSFQCVDNLDELIINTETSPNERNFDDDRNSCEYNKSSQLTSPQNDVKAATFTKDNPSTTGGENIKSYVESSTCERYCNIL